MLQLISINIKTRVREKEYKGEYIMKIKKISMSILVIGIIISGFIVSNAALNQNEKVSTKEVQSTFEDAMTSSKLGENYIEHITITSENGEKVDMYIDRENYLEQSDTYDGSGKLISRNIVYDKGAKVISIGEENNEYEANIMTLDSEIAASNKELFENESQLVSYVEGTLDSIKVESITEKTTINSSIVKYSNKEKNLYFNQEDENFLVKEEYLKNGEIYQTTEYEKINKDSDKVKDLFKKDSPVNNKSGEFLKNIKTSYINSGKDVLLDDARG